MIGPKKIVVVLPAYNAAKTLRRTYDEIPHDIVDEVILTDDGSSDTTPEIAADLGIRTILHAENAGYGANQKTCFDAALQAGADVVVMLHPDYQYDPRLVRAFSSIIADGVYDVVIGSRILGGRAMSGGMPVYRYVANRLLTAAQNVLTGAKLSEYHTGYRAFSREVLERLPLLPNSDDFLFDNQMLLQILYFDYRIGEVSCPTRYNEDSSSINFQRSVKYGLGCLITGALYRLGKWGVLAPRIFCNQSGQLLSGGLAARGVKR